MDSVDNWHRWGKDDELGTFNLITPELVKVAAGLVKTGTVYSLSVPLEAEGPRWPTRPKPWRVTLHMSEKEHGPAGSGDALVIHTHTGTHVDALCHFWYDDQLYNGFIASESINSAGAHRGSIDRLPHIVGRAVLLDIAAWKGVDHLDRGEPVNADDLDRCAKEQGVDIRHGDILLVRTGWMRVFHTDRALFDAGEPGLDESTIPWLQEHDIVAVGSDNHAVEAINNIPYDNLPLHSAAIRDLGIYLMENFDLDALSRDNVYESMIIVAPLRLTGGAGSPVNPIAIA